MNEFQLVINKKLLKVNILADIIEAEIKGITPEVNVNNTSVVQKLASLEGSCKRFRKVFDSINDEFALKLGDVSDIIDEKINEILK
jgi:hypothetical protein